MKVRFHSHYIHNIWWFIMKNLQDIVTDLYELAMYYVIDCHMEIHEANRLISIADELKTCALIMEDDLR